MRPVNSILLTLTICCCIASSALAQGTISGTVRDTLTQEKLVAASIQLTGTALGCASNIEGEYKISNIPAGNYRIKVSYIGYEPKIVEVRIEKNKAVKMDFYMTAGVIEGRNVMVTAQALGQAAAINQQVNSNTIINVISEEKIKEMPDANAAEAIGRLPGVALQRSGGEANKVVLRGMSDKFSSVTVDGVKIAPTDVDSRGVDLSAISQGSLAGIELFKALTPDKDADAIAGAVNLVTRKAPSKRSIRVDAKGAYNKLNDTYSQYDFSVKYGERFFGDLLGIQLNGNIEQRDRSNEKIDVDYNSSLKDATDYEITNFKLNYTDEIRKRGGVSLLLDYATPDGGFVKFNNIYNRTKRDYVLYGRNYPTSTEDLFYSARNRELEIKTFNSSLSGENYLLGFTATWGLSFAQSNSDCPYDLTLTFKEPSVLDSLGNPISKMRNVPAELRKGPLESIIPYAINNFEQAFLYTATFRGESSLDKEKTAFLNLSKQYTLSDDITGEFKFGGKYRYKNRTKVSTEFLSPYYLETLRKYVMAEDGSIVLKNFSGTIFDGALSESGPIPVTYFLGASPENRDVYDKYNLYPMISRDALRLWYDLNKKGYATEKGADPEYSRNYEADAYFYDIIERVGAGYLMNTLNLGNKISVITGLRVESENNDYRSRFSPDGLSGFPTPKGALKDTTATAKETIWLPNFHVTYRPAEFLTVRLAAYRALARPDFNYKLESFVASSNGTFHSGNSLYIGNPNLRAAKAWNFEVNSSLYSNTIGLFSVSAFYKEVKDMFHVVNGIRVNGQNVLDSLGISWQNPYNGNDYELTYPYNSSKPTKVWGFEVEHQMNLKFLPGLLQNIVISYNFSIVRSETYVASSRLEKYKVKLPGLPFPIEKTRTIIYDLKQKLEGQPEFFGNFSFGYDYKGFSGRLSVFYQGEYKKSFSADGKSDQIVDDYTRWDLALKQNVTDYLAVILNINNLTNIEESTSIQNNTTNWHLLNTSEKYGLTVDLGVRLTL